MDQLVPPKIPRVKNISGKALQAWPRKVTACPKGIVPFKRITADNMSKAQSFQDFGRKRKNKALVTPTD